MVIMDMASVFMVSPWLFNDIIGSGAVHGYHG